MNQQVSVRVRDPLRHELSELRANWVWILVLGIATIVLGMILIGAPMATNLGAMLFLSVLMTITGLIQILGAFWVRRWSGFFLHLLVGILYVAVGVLTFEHPLQLSTALTLLIALFLIVGGVARIIVSLALRFEGWAWPLLSGVISLLLGLMIWRQWPLSGLYIIGLFLGLEVLFQGWTWVMLALAIRSLPRAEGDA